MLVNDDTVWKQIIRPDYTFIIAEAGVNHNSDLSIAKELIDVASEANADAVKFQSFIAENLVTFNAPKANYQIRRSNKTESQYDMLKKLELSINFHEKLIDHCQKKNVIFLSTPFDYHSLNMLCELNIPVIKISSGDITNIPFLEHIAELEKPVILSTGMSNLSEVEKAVRSIINNGEKKLLALMHCVSNYPAKYQDINLNVINTLQKAFDLPVGYSDHSIGIEIPIAAVAIGSVIIEKHFTLNKNFKGPDHKASAEPDELKKMIDCIRNIEKAMGNGIKYPSKDEIEISKIARKSIVANCNIQKGAIVSDEMFAIKRPGNGLKPDMIKWIVGKKINQSVAKDTILTWEMF